MSYEQCVGCFCIFCTGIGIQITSPTITGPYSKYWKSLGWKPKLSQPFPLCQGERLGTVVRCRGVVYTLTEAGRLLA